MDFKLPQLGEGVYEAEFVAWLVLPGDVVHSGQNLLEVMTDKATMEVPAPFAGTIDALLVQPGQKVKVGDVVLSYHTADVPAVAATPAVASPKAATPLPNGAPPLPAQVALKAAPSVRQLARKLGIDLNQVHGSGPGGRILIDDLSTHVPGAPPVEKKPASPPPNYGKPGTRIKMQGLRRVIAEHMVRSKHTIPHYSYIDECDVTELVRLREQLREPLAQDGVKLTYLAFLVKATTVALKEVPLVNASLSEADEEIVLHDRYHIGVAVSTPGGLVVPVIHDADRLSLVEIARAIERLSSAARAGKVRREELKGGTFTVTSVGNIGGLISTPVINHPEVGILGVGKVVKRPVFDAQGQVRAADLVYLSFSFDHRVLDGAVGAVFANAVIRQLQRPAVLLL